MITWGKGDVSFKLGHGDVEVCAVPRIVDELKKRKCRDVDMRGPDHTAVLLQNGAVHTFGKGRFSVLGHGNNEDQLKPKQVMALQTTCIEQIQCGEEFTLARSIGGINFFLGLEWPALLSFILPHVLNHLR